MDREKALNFLKENKPMPNDINLDKSIITMYDEVVNYLLEALKSKYNGVKYWCAQISALFPDEKLINSLAKLLSDTNEDIRMSVITSMAEIKDNKVFIILKNHLNFEKDDEIKDFLVDVIEDIEEYI